jgi:NADH:ubiquinone oxidoreductase subunit 6 (subunit J)
MLLVLNFYFILSLGIIISSSFVVFSSNPIYSLLWLVMSFLFSSSLLLILGCEFLALIFLVVYVGAIAVLFLFVVMLLDLKINNLRSKKNNAFFSVSVFGFIFLFCLLSFNLNFIKYEFIFFNFNFVYQEYFIDFKSLLSNFSFTIDKINFIFINWKDFVHSLNEIEIYSVVLYDIFVVQFLLVGFILLSVLIGVVFLTNSYESSKVLEQATFKQISLNSNFFYK